MALGALSLFTLFGCATASRVALDGKEKQINSTQGCAVLRHQEIGADINNSNMSTTLGASGGLIGSLVGSCIDSGIENSRTKKAALNVVSIRNALNGYDVGKTFADALHTELVQTEWLNKIQITGRYVSDASDLRSWVASISADAVLVTDMDYRMTPNFDGITIYVRASIRAHTPALAALGIAKDDLPAAIYYNQLSIVVHPPIPPGATKFSTEEWIKLWLVDDGKPLRLALDNGFVEIAKMVAFDLKQPGTTDGALYKAPSGSETKVASFPLDNGAIGTVKGFVVHTEGLNAWLRMPAGQLVSVPK